VKELSIQEVRDGNQLVSQLSGELAKHLNDFLKDFENNVAMLAICKYEMFEEPITHASLKMFMLDMLLGAIQNISKDSIIEATFKNILVKLRRTGNLKRIMGMESIKVE